MAQRLRLLELVLTVTFISTLLLSCFMDLRRAGVGLQVLVLSVLLVQRGLLGLLVRRVRRGRLVLRDLQEQREQVESRGRVRRH